MSRSIIQHTHHYSVLSPLSSSLSTSHPRYNPQHFTMFNNTPKPMIYSSCTRSSQSFETKAIGNPSSLLLGVATARPGDISVLLQTSAVMLFVYWIANFVVPSIVIKEFKEKKEEDAADDDESSRS